MLQIRKELKIWGAWIAICAMTAHAQVRVTPQSAKGGHPLEKAWEGVPEGFRNLNVPEFNPPDNPASWQTKRLEVRKTLMKCLGFMPPRPMPLKVHTISRAPHEGYLLERFEFENGVDSRVPGILMLPKNRRGRLPAVIVMHGHGSSKETVMTLLENPQCVGPILARSGYVVAVIDTYFNGERIGTGPAGKGEGKENALQENTLFKLNLWLGRTLWGMMLRDQQILLDYLQTRPEVDPQHIGATGMSMGSTGSCWLAAIDERVKVAVGVACFTRYTELIAHGALRRHAFNIFIPGLLQHFDTEAIYGLIAPRPLLMLTGDEDRGSPIDGIEVLEGKLTALYGLLKANEQFRSEVYLNTGHEYLPEMKAKMVAWFDRLLRK